MDENDDQKFWLISIVNYDGHFGRSSRGSLKSFGLRCSVCP